jgi:hypothetical protein
LYKGKFCKRKMGQPAYSGTLPYVRSKTIVKLRKELAKRRADITRANKNWVECMKGQTKKIVSEK